MAPWGTPAPISAGADVQPSTVVIWRRDVKKVFIQANAEPHIPAASSLDRRPSCHTRLNAFRRSKRERQHKLNCRCACSIPGKAAKAGDCPVTFFFCLKALGKIWKMTPLLCACAVVITLETQKCRKRAPRSVKFNFFTNCDRHKRFSQNNRRRPDLQNFASDF